MHARKDTCTNMGCLVVRLVRQWPLRRGIDHLFPHMRLRSQRAGSVLETWKIISLPFRLHLHMEIPEAADYFCLACSGKVSSNDSTAHLNEAPLPVPYPLRRPGRWKRGTGADHLATMHQRKWTMREERWISRSRWQSWNMEGMNRATALGYKLDGG